MQKQELVLSIIIVLIKNIKSMAKLFINGECIMHDIIESIKSVEAGLQAEGINYLIEWDWV